MGILDGIVEWIAEQVMHGLDLINTSVLGALGCDMSVFLRYFPAAETMYQVFVALAIGLILLLWVWNLFKNFGLGTSSEAEDPVKFMFPRLVYGNSATRLVLKHPKTESSNRTIWLPKTLAYILRDWKVKQDKLKEFMGEEYTDYNLVLALETGRPCEDRVIGNQFARLKKSAELPDVVFHSLRHSSTTYKLKLNHGDIKATQGDTGHAQASMVTEVYAHILDEERKINAQKFEMAFYASPDMRGVERELNPPRETEPAVNLQKLVAQLQENPELAAQLKALLHTA